MYVFIPPTLIKELQVLLCDILSVVIVDFQLHGLRKTFAPFTYFNFQISVNVEGSNPERTIPTWGISNFSKYISSKNCLRSSMKMDTTKYS